MTEEKLELVEGAGEKAAAEEDVEESGAGAGDAACECGHDRDHDCDCEEGCDCPPDEPCSCGCEEAFEIEIEEDDIVGYLYDEDDNEIGIIVLDEDGDEVELLYAEEGDYEYVDEEPAAKPKKSGGEEYDLGITREGVAQATDDMNAIYKDGIQVAAELKSTFDDITEGFSFLKKKR